MEERSSSLSPVTGMPNNSTQHSPGRAPIRGSRRLRPGHHPTHRAATAGFWAWASSQPATDRKMWSGTSLMTDCKVQFYTSLKGRAEGKRQILKIIITGLTRLEKTVEIIKPNLWPNTTLSINHSTKQHTPSFHKHLQGRWLHHLPGWWK